MNRENRARIRAIRDGLVEFANELDEIFPEEISGKKIPAEEIDELIAEETTTNWTTADKESKEGLYLKDLAEMTTLKDIVITGQIKTIMDLKSYATKEGKKGLVYRVVLGDPTGDVVVVAFDEMADKLKTYTIGQYLRITNAWQMKANKHGVKELHVGNFAKIEVVE